MGLSPEEFGNIVVRANPDGSIVRMRDVARVELGARNYTQIGRLNEKPLLRSSPSTSCLARTRSIRWSEPSS